MKTNAGTSRFAQWPVYWIGLSTVAVGGGFALFAAARMMTGFVHGAGPLRAGPWLFAQITGGLILLIVGFAAMAGSAHFAEGAAVDFDLPEKLPGAADETRTEGQPPFESTKGDAFARIDPAGATEPFGPPKPFIMVRCRDCQTLNSEDRTECTQCGSPV